MVFFFLSLKQYTLQIDSEDIKYVSTSGGTSRCQMLLCFFLFAVLLWTQLAGQLVDLWD